MIDPRAVDQFLGGVRDSHVWIKDIKRRDLWKALDDLDFRPLSEERLDTHQLACILLGAAYPRFSFWLDMGTGKTRIVLELLNHFWRKRLVRRALTTVISEEAVYGWEDEITKWGFKVPYVALGNSPSDEKWQNVAELGAGLILVTYAGFNYMFSQKVQNKKKRKGCLKPDKSRIARFAEGLDAFVSDESVHLGNHNSLSWDCADRISRNCYCVYALAGVPFGRDPTLLWAQQYLVDRGTSFGSTLGMFREAFFAKRRGWFTRYEYKFMKSREPQLTRLMQHRSISYGEGECFDLPPVRAIRHRIKLPPEMFAYFEKFIEEMRMARGDRERIENIFLRMRQLSSGFIGYRNDETGERAQFVFDKNPKLQDCLDTIEDIPRDSKFVIFYEWTFSGRTIVEALEKRGYKVGWLWSGTKDAKTIKRRFDNEDPRRMGGLIINHKKGAESLNLQRANYLYAYETPVGVIQRRQMERRCFRKGQTRKGFLIDPICTKVDARVLDFHREGRDFFRAIMGDPLKALGLRVARSA